MNLVHLTIRVGKKFAIYLPKEVIKELNIKEGDILLLGIRNDEIILKHIKSELPKVKYWSKVSPDEVEKVGEEISKTLLKRSSS